MRMKIRQSCKIREIGDALVSEGFLTLDQQADALGLCRSTAWTILRASHKCSGLSAALINRMLAAPRLPPLVRATILEYVEEKLAGSYGHSKKQLRRFTAGLFARPARRARTEVDTKNPEVEELLPPCLLWAFPTIGEV
jgi:hypothetical protein